MRLNYQKRVVLLSANQVYDGIIPKPTALLIAANAWRERYDSRSFHLPDDVLVSKFITHEHLSDDEISELFVNSYNLFRYLEMLLIHFHSRGTLVEIEVDHYVDDTIAISVTRYGA